MGIGGGGGKGRRGEGNLYKINKNH
jgi:hypothetical protein